ncbi:MAG: tRNA-dihydrouridine synthase [Candidatus Omnitrophota bacterium]
MEPKVYLAPLSGITDLSFRLISRQFGAAHCFYEMLDSKATLYGSAKNLRLLKTLKKDSPIAAQLLGADASIMLDAAQKLIALTNMEFLDINAACPAKKVIKKKAGAYLLQDTAALGKIIRRLASRLGLPVTVKLRTGFYKEDIKECVKVAMACEANGASTIFIHGRTVLQGYSGGVDYGSIKAVKESVKIPVFGSGNIFGHEMAKKMLDETGCDGILVARGALGNPWIFKEIIDYLKSGKAPICQSLAAKKKVLKEHLSFIEHYKEIGPSNKIGFMGKVAMWYLSGVAHAKTVRGSISGVRSYKELVDVINKVPAATQCMRYTA